jgi:hypothetical protein
MALAFLGAEIAASRHKKRSQRGQLPPGKSPGVGGQAYQRLPSAGPGRKLPPVDPGHRRVTEVARRRLSRPSLPVHIVHGC